jgi:hypothetical protein
MLSAEFDSPRLQEVVRGQLRVWVYRHRLDSVLEHQIRLLLPKSCKEVLVHNMLKWLYLGRCISTSGLYAGCWYCEEEAVSHISAMDLDVAVKLRLTGLQ